MALSVTNDQIRQTLTSVFAREFEDLAEDRVYLAQTLAAYAKHNVSDEDIDAVTYEIREYAGIVGILLDPTILELVTALPVNFLQDQGVTVGESA